MTQSTDSLHNNTPYGYIYKITHPAEKGCYVGKTRVSIIERWKKHLNDGEKALNKRSAESKRTDGKLHERIAINRATKDQFCVEELDVGYSKCHLVQLEHDNIIKHDALNPLTGWNIILPNPDQCVEDLEKGEIHTIDGKEYIADSFSDLCRKAKVPATSVLYWRRKGKNIQEAILRVREHQLKPKKIYIIFRQRFNSISDLSKSNFNKNNLDKKTIERRINLALRNGELEIEFDQKQNNSKIILVPEVLKRPTGSDGPYVVIAPDGVKYGPTKFKKELWELVMKNYPDIPPYQTFVNRLTSLGWKIEQALEFEVPPNFEYADEFVKQKNYKYEPPWEKVKKSKYSNSIPVILHETKEVFLSRTLFSEKYGIEKSLVSDRFLQGLTAIEVLKYYDREP